MIKLGRDALQQFNTASGNEWLETNGLGGFSSSTITGLNTRRYHGLLTAATKPPVGRVVMLAKLEEVLIVDGERYELSVNQYAGAVHPHGFYYQSQFRLDPFPIFTYELAGIRLEKSVFMVQGQNTTIVHYELQAGDANFASLKLELRPLIAFRDYHTTTHENSSLNPRVETEDGIISVTPYADLPSLHFAHDVAGIDTRGYWYHNFEYLVEQERGLDFVEDLFSPFSLTFDLNRYGRARIIASTERRDIRSADFSRETESSRRRTIALNKTNENRFITMLTSAADQFIVARGNKKTVIAGYHWFGDWGRDTMIALPGLTLTTGRFEVARSILAEFANHVDQGMLPNRFVDAGDTPEYNTVDATLWFFEAVRSFLQYTNDYDFVRDHLYAVLVDIIEWHIEGTRYNIRVDTDGLLMSGAPGVQLTWMDAKVGDWVVTPRHGKPVEIQALWYNALRSMEQLARKFGNQAAKKRYATMANQVRDNFNEQFWNERALCLFDVVNGDFRDESIRPNQLLAISLKNSMISWQRAENILNVVKRELLTPRGLRTLSPKDPDYRGSYKGDPSTRDAAYHQGTVWPWLMGPFITASVKVFGVDGQAFASEWLKDFEDHLTEACLGQVSEIFDGDAPHLPRGCVAQAWSVAELLRCAVEDVFHSEVSSVSAKSVAV